MKLLNSVPKTTGTQFDLDVDAALLSAAKDQRRYYFGGNNRKNNTPVYLEWGENINIILWNLPARAY